MGYIILMHPYFINLDGNFLQLIVFCRFVIVLSSDISFDMIEYTLKEIFHSIFSISDFYCFFMLSEFFACQNCTSLCQNLELAVLNHAA